MSQAGEFDSESRRGGAVVLNSLRASLPLLMAGSLITITSCGEPIVHPAPDAGKPTSYVGPYEAPGLRIDMRLVKYSVPVATPDRGGSMTDEVLEVDVRRDVPWDSPADEPYVTIGERMLVRYKVNREDPRIMTFTDFEPSNVPEGANVIFQWGNYKRASRTFDIGVVFRRADLVVEQR